jgi:hypothetical protein
MRHVSRLLSVGAAIALAASSATAFAQFPPIPGLPGQDPNQPQQPAPQQPPPQQPPPQQPAPQQPVLPGGLPVPQLPPGFPQLPGQPQPAPAQPNPDQPQPYPPAQPGYGQPYPQPGYGQPYPQQPYPQQPGYGQPYAPYAPQPYGPPGQGPYPPPNYGPKTRTTLEIAYLYGTSIAYGVGAGIWIDSEAYNGKRIDPGIAAIAPILFGAAMPALVFVADMKPMREGLPSAIASGLLIGGGEGLVAYAYGAGHSSTPIGTPNPWGFTALGRAEIIGATLGGASGVAYGLLLHPTPKKTMLITSGAAWGGIIGYQFGGGATSVAWNLPYPQTGARAGTTTGGLIGYNIGFIGTAVAAGFWTPSWNQLGWMWGGFGIGEAVSALVYPIYAGTGGDPRHGLIFQGVTGTVGAVAGAFIGKPDRPGAVAREEKEDEEWLKHPHFARIRGGGLMPVQGGAGASLSGQLW